MKQIRGEEVITDSSLYRHGYRIIVLRFQRKKSINESLHIARTNTSFLMIIKKNTNPELFMTFLPVMDFPGRRTPRYYNIRCNILRTVSLTSNNPICYRALYRKRAITLRNSINRIISLKSICGERLLTREKKTGKTKEKKKRTRRLHTPGATGTVGRFRDGVL